MYEVCGEKVESALDIVSIIKELRLTKHITEKLSYEIEKSGLLSTSFSYTKLKQENELNDKYAIEVRTTESPLDSDSDKDKIKRRLNWSM